MRKINFENERYLYRSSRAKRMSTNGLYVLSAGESLPNPRYYYERIKEFMPSHDGLIVMEYVCSGKGYIECEGKKYTVGAGDLFVLTRYHAHKYYSDPFDPFHKKWVNLAGPLLGNIVDSLGLKEGVYIKHLGSPGYIEQIHALLEQYNSTFKSRIFDNVALVATELLLMINSSENAQKSSVLPVVFEIKKYIDREENPSINLDEICEKFMINKSYAIATFKREFGITLYQYMLEKKIRMAENMLESGESISNITDKLGYSCTQSFNRAFKSMVGISPSAYREKNYRERD